MKKFFTIAALGMGLAFGFLAVNVHASITPPAEDEVVVEAPQGDAILFPGQYNSDTFNFKMGGDAPAIGEDVVPAPASLKLADAGNPEPNGIIIIPPPEGPTPAPEPATLMLLGAGAAGLTGLVRRRKKLLK